VDDPAIRAGIQQCRPTRVVPSDQVGRVAATTADLLDLAFATRSSDLMTFDDQLVTDSSKHVHDPLRRDPVSESSLAVVEPVR
jgi:hypothetical protein